MTRFTSIAMISLFMYEKIVFLWKTTGVVGGDGKVKEIYGKEEAVSSQDHSFLPFVSALESFL